MQLIAFIAGGELSCCCKKSLKIRAIPILFATWFDSGVIFVISYSFLMLILCDQLFILIPTVHWPICPSMLCFPFFSLALVVCSRHTHPQHFCSGCDQKKITSYRNFFRNLDFKNIVNFFNRTCWQIRFQQIFFCLLTVFLPYVYARCYSTLHFLPSLLSKITRDSLMV